MKAVTENERNRNDCEIMASEIDIDLNLFRKQSFNSKKSLTRCSYMMKAGEKYAIDSFGTPYSTNLRVVAASVTAKPI